MGTMMMMSSTMMPSPTMSVHFMFCHHILLRTLFAPLRNDCAETAKPSVLSCRASSRSPRSATLAILSLIAPTVSSICCWICAVWDVPALAPPAAPPAAGALEDEPPRGRYGSYGSDISIVRVCYFLFWQFINGVFRRGCVMVRSEFRNRR